MSDVASPPVASCPECVHLRTLLEAALQRIAELEAEVHDLRGQLTRNSSNSSTPPSADPPGAPKPVVKRLPLSRVRPLIDVGPNRLDPWFCPGNFACKPMM